MDCLFCKIISGEIPSKKVYEDEFVYAFYDIAPQSPVHVLFIPKVHIAGIDCINSNNSHVLPKIFESVAATARELGLENGYRVISNIGEHGQQSVRHLHFHLLGGKQLTCEMG